MRTEIFIPAYNAEKSLGKIIASMPKSISKKDIVVVDDGSKDNTYGVAKKLGVTVLKHSANKGYGGAQKTAYNYAIKNGYDAVVMVHADGQHDPKQLPEFIRMLGGGYDAITGTRFRGGAARKEGMPAARYYGNLFLSGAVRTLTGLKVSETHNGYRAYLTKALKSVNFNANSDKYEFDTEILLRLKSKKMKIGEIPIRTIYAGEKSYLNIYNYGFRIMKVVLRYAFLKKYRD